MKILFITSDVNQTGGVERILSILANYFSINFKYEVEILSVFSSENNLFFEYEEAVKITHGNLHNSINKLELIKSIKKLLLDNKSDIILTFHGYISDVVLLNKYALKNKKIIVTEHVDYYDSSKKRRILRSVLYKFADKVVVLNNKSKEQYEKYLNNVKVIPNCISFTTDKISTQNNNKIIAVGRLEKVKRFNLLIEIFHEISHRYEDWTLDIVGAGSQKEYLEELIDKYGLIDRVNIKPFTRNIIDEFLGASIYALTSELEGFGLVLIEAMECGLPCISFDIDAAKEIILNKEDGIIVPNNDLNEFTRQLSLMMDNYELRKKYGIEGKKNVQKYYPNNICNEWKLLFESLI